MSLSVCPSCSRHVRESSCPFCGADVTPVVVTTSPRVARIALVGAAAVLTACSAQALYGGPMPDAAPPNDAAQSDAGNDAMATFYGGPPIDAGTD